MNGTLVAVGAMYDIAQSVDAVTSPIFYLQVVERLGSADSVGER